MLQICRHQSSTEFHPFLNQNLYLQTSLKALKTALLHNRCQISIANLDLVSWVFVLSFAIAAITSFSLVPPCKTYSFCSLLLQST